MRIGAGPYHPQALGASQSFQSRADGPLQILEPPLVVRFDQDRQRPWSGRDETGAGGQGDPRRVRLERHDHMVAPAVGQVAKVAMSAAGGDAGVSQGAVPSVLITMSRRHGLALVLGDTLRYSFDRQRRPVEDGGDRLDFRLG